MKAAPLMVKGTFRIWSNICCHPDIFFRDDLLISERQCQNSFCVLQHCGFVVKEWGTRLSCCSTDLSSIENVWHFMKLLSEFYFQNFNNYYPQFLKAYWLFLKDKVMHKFGTFFRKALQAANSE